MKYKYIISININLFVLAGTARIEKDGIYVISVDEYDGIRTHLVAIYSKNIKAIYFDKLNIFLKKKNIKIKTLEKIIRE